MSRLLEVSTDIKVRKAQLEDMAYVRVVAMNAAPAAVTTREIERESERDDEMRSVYEYVQFGN